MGDSTRERFYFYNTLSILLKAVLNERTTVDLRNEASVYGTIEHVDAYMNIVMKDCVFTDPRGRCFDYDMFFVHARNIRCVQIPPKEFNDETHDSFENHFDTVIFYRVEQKY